MMRPAKTEEGRSDEIDFYNIHNLTREEREKLHMAPLPDKNGHRSSSRSPVYNRRQKRLKFLPGEEVGVVTEQVFVCPNCKHKIKLTEAISASVVERLRRQFEAEAREKGEQLAKREQALTAKSAEIEKAKLNIDAQVAEQLKAERQRVAKEEAKKASDALATEMTDLRQQLDDKASKLDAERKTIREAAQKDMAEEHRLKEAEKEQQLPADLSTFALIHRVRRVAISRLDDH